MKSLKVMILTAAVLLMAAVSQAATLSIDEKGIKISTGGATSFILGFPELRGEGEKIFKTTDKKVAGKDIKMKFEGGGEAVVTVDKDKITIKHERLPDGAKYIRMTMQINFDYAMSAKYKVGNGQLVAFPSEKPPSPHIFQGNETVFELDGVSGKLKMTAPQYSFMQLTDCRQWDWKNFTFFFHYPIVKEVSVNTITIN